MAEQPRKTSEEMQRSLEDILEASRRLRERAKENVVEADRIMKVVHELEAVFKMQSDPDSN